MARVILDWDKKRKKAIIASNFLEHIRAELSVPNAGKKVMERKKLPSYYMSDIISPISKSGVFDFGLYFEIIETLKNARMDYEITTTESMQEQLIQTYGWSKEYAIPELSNTLRPYQESSIKRCIHMGYGIVIVGTAGGKTLIMASLLQTIRNNQKDKATYFVILPAQLIKQTYKDFIEYGIPKEDIHIWTKDGFKADSPIIFASAETLRNNITSFKSLPPKSELDFLKELKRFPSKQEKYEDYKDYVKQKTASEKERAKVWNKNKRLVLKYIENVDLVLIDEVHGLRRGNAINRVLDKFTTRHKFGFTGTLPEDKLDKWNIFGQIGPVLVDVDTAQLREMEYIAQVKVQVIRLNHKKVPSLKIDLDNPTSAYLTECDFLFFNAYRNKAINHITKTLNKNILIMVDKIDHGEKLKEILSMQQDKHVVFVRGSLSIEDREKLRAQMEIQDNIICIAMSRIFAKGINIKNIHYIVFAQGGKARITIVQSIGRGLRLHKNKEQLIVLDIADNTHYSEKHLFDRIRFYEEEKITHEIKDLYE